MDKKVMTPHEAEIDRLLQIMAVLLVKLNGEVVISRAEIEEMYGVPVLTRVIAPDYVLLHLGLSDEESGFIEVEEIDLPDDNLQP